MTPDEIRAKVSRVGKEPQDVLYIVIVWTWILFKLYLYY